MKASSIKQIILLLIAGSLILFLGGLGIGVWIARSKISSEEQTVNQRLMQQERDKFQLLSSNTNIPESAPAPEQEGTNR